MAWRHGCKLHRLLPALGKHLVYLLLQIAYPIIIYNKGAAALHLLLRHLCRYPLGCPFG